ncbi:MAG: murein biosynthesis integral membrane protein MurJ, partial [bacterium]|nr:murein biosynthesis integral membrane protein MurJ [bacterium]
NRVVFPYILLVGMVAWAMGILNSFKHFFAPAFSQVLFNLSMIYGAVFLTFYFSNPIFGLAAGVLLGGVLQILIQLPYLSRIGMRLRGPVNLFHPGLKKILVLMGPAAFGLAVYQLNVLVGTLLASFLPRGSISYLFYADRVMEFPMGVFAIALATAILPTMSEKTAQRDLEGLKQTLNYSLKLLLFIILPATAAFIILRVPIIQLLFERGQFGPAQTQATASTLLAYTVGLVAFAGIRVVVPTFYSLKDTWTPVKVALAAFFLNLVLSLLLMRPLQYTGLALATSLAAFLNLGLLLYLLHRKVGTLQLSQMFGSGSRMLFASLVMGFLAWLIARQIGWSAQTHLYLRILVLSAAIVVGAGSYFLVSFLLKIEEAQIFLNVLRRRSRKPAA